MQKNFPDQTKQFPKLFKDFQGPGETLLLSVLVIIFFNSLKNFLTHFSTYVSPQNPSYGQKISELSERIKKSQLRNKFISE